MEARWAGRKQMQPGTRDTPGEKHGFMVRYRYYGKRYRYLLQYCILTVIVDDVGTVSR
jgi:hypothetical protein